MEPALERPRYGLHLGLFLVTCATTFTAGAGLGEGFSIGRGLAFGGTLMFILSCHEMGHYVVARRHKLPTSLPYFIPLPPGISLGTMGAVIRMPRPIEDRDQLFDVGAAGPLAGLAVAIPLLVLGLWLSPVERSTGGGVLEGNSLLYLGMKYLVHGRYLPAPDGTDVQLHPIGFAAWLGLLITFINLIPVGQLDGGHVACAYLGPRHEGLSRRLHRGLLVMAAAVTLALASDAHAGGAEWLAALGVGLRGALPWLVWAALLLLMRRASDGLYHPPVGAAPLSPGRRRRFWFMAALFVLIFTPVPLRSTLAPLFGAAPSAGALAPRESP